MSFISYSQNGEDVLLWRALGAVATGFYIDVGANDPTLHSVTRAFYDAGWRGINIEPMPSYSAPFLAQRPRDINLSCACGAAPGAITLFDVPAMNGWASTDATVAAAHRSEGHAVTEVEVPLRTLADICAEHAPARIHFLKIDVEGFEGEVLKGMDFRRFRPWIVVIEATVPGTRATNFAGWEALITDHGYRFAWFDGLNRYYVADEHAELAERLAMQPNVFDDYLPHHLVDALDENRALHQQVASHWQRVEELDTELARQLEALATAQARAGTIEVQRERLAALHAQLETQINAERERHLQRELALGEQHRGQQLALVGQHRGQELALVEQHRQQELALQARHLERERELDAHLADQRAQLEAALAHARELEGALHGAASWGKDMEQRLLAVYASRSWRITAPLRVLTRRGEGSVWRRTRGGFKGALRRVLRWLTTREWLRRALLPVIMRSPFLQRRVARTLSAARALTAAAPAPGAGLAAELRDLSLAERAALDELRQAYHHGSAQ